MSEFVYSGVDKAGKKVNGKLDAPTEGDLRMTLRTMGVRPTKISKANALNQDLGNMFKSARGMSSEQLVAFTRQLQVLMSSGVPVVQALEVLSEQADVGAARDMVNAIREKVTGGSYLWEALNAYPKTFPRLYVALIRAGESAGAMDQMLKRLSRYIEDSERLKKMIKGAMMYPIIVLSIGAAVISLLLIFVIPRFETLLTSAGQELPLPTKIVLVMSHKMVSNAHFILVGGGIGIYLLVRYIKSQEGRNFIDRLTFRAPIFGNLLQKSGVARFARTLQTLLASGVNLIDAIDICKATIDNIVLEEAVAKIRAEVEAGKTLGGVVGRLNVFPKMAVQMISVGESTGNLDKMLEKIADFYEEEVEVIVGGMTKLIEPIVLVFLGGSVGGMLIAMYLPIFKIAGATGD